MTLTTDFNVDPYYDNFDEDKDFHRVLFRPGYAVQARELTQIQTYLQNQMAKHGNHIFKEGTIVAGCELSLDLNYTFVQLRDDNHGGGDVTPSLFLANTVTGNTTGVTAKVIGYADGTEAGAPEYNTLFIKYLAAGSNNTAQIFSADEVLTSTSGLNANTVDTTTHTGIGSAVTIGAGIIYAKGMFIRVASQTLVLDKYNNVPSYKVGYTLTETTVDSTTDATLLDPAQGSFNFAAPGADRLKIVATLAKKLLNTNDLSDFFELMQINEGTVQARGDRTEYSSLRKEFARRTMDESGNYTVNPMPIRVREHLDDGTNLGYLTTANGGDSNKLAIGVEPGKAYVHGYEYETLITDWLTADKGTDTIEVDAQPIPANYGNYVIVDEFSGVWNVGNVAQVSLRDTAANGVQLSTYGNTAAPGSEIGTAFIRAVVHESGTPSTRSATYRLYLFDVQMTSGTFGSVRSVYLNNASGSDAVADCVLESSVAVMKETGFNTSVFHIPQSYVKQLKDAGDAIDNNFQFLKDVDVSIIAAGTFTITTSGTETLPYSTGLLNATQKLDGFVVTLKADATTASLPGTADITAASNTINGIGSTDFTNDFDAGDQVSIGGSGPWTVSAVTDANTMVITTQPGVTAANTYTKFYPAGYVMDMGGTGTDGSRTVNITGTTTADFDLQDTFSAGVDGSVQAKLKITNGPQLDKDLKSDRFVMFDTSSHTANTVGPWGMGMSDVFNIVEVRKKSSAFSAITEGTDVTTHFDLNTGQKDNYYDHGLLELKSTSSLVITSGDHILVKFDYFTHNSSSGVGYLSVDSYPVDDANTSSTTISTKEIPIFTSPTTGEQFDLRDSVDIRPIRTNVASDQTAWGSITSNPANSASFVVPTGGVHMVPPNEDMTYDLEYYLGRKDKIVLDLEGQFKILKGVPALVPRTPEDIDSGMSLAVVTIPPFPSLAPNVARDIGRTELSSTIKQMDNRRFTMKDISVLEQRINNLEYYTSLSLLEKDTGELQILDGSGVDRFKNGMFVDSFTGHGVGDVTNVDYAIAVDEKEQSIRPQFSLNNVELDYDSSNSTNIVRQPNDIKLTYTALLGTFTLGETVYQGTLGSETATGVLVHDNVDMMFVEQTTLNWATSTTVTGATSGATGTVTATETPTNGDLLTLPYVHSVFVHQPFASKTRNATGELQFNWIGTMTLDPDQDSWTDTTQKPDVQVNFDGNMDAWEQLSNAWGTQWNDWQTNWTGSSTSSETADVGINRITFGGSGQGSIFGRTETTRTTTTTQRQSRTGIQLNVRPGTQTQSIGPKVVDVSVVPFMRSRLIEVTIDGMKPNARVYAFFDGEDVNAYCAEVSAFTAANLRAPSYGSAMTTDSTGSLLAVFRIPNDTTLRFRTGLKVLKFTDSITNVTTDVSSAASANYNATGLLQTTENTIISTRTPNVTINSVGDTRTTSDVSVVTTSGERFVGRTPPATVTNVTNVTAVTNVQRIVDNTFPVRLPDNIESFGNRWLLGAAEAAGLVQGGGAMGDPLAQSFYVRQPGGIFISKIDLYFQSKSSTLPLTVEIREMINGLPGPKVVPFGTKTLAAASINTSTNASKVTPFHFDTPVYLKNEQEYVFVIKPAGNSPDYNLWVALLGGSDIFDSDVRITKQPAAGVMFTSANDRSWTEHQDEDIKFTIHRAAFDETSTGTLVLTNEDSEFFQTGAANTVNIGEIIHGEPRLTISLSAGSANVGDVWTGSTSSANGTVTDVTGSVIRLRDVLVGTKFTTAETITSPLGGTATISSQTTPQGVLKYYNSNDSTDIKMHLGSTPTVATSGTFANGEILVGQTSNNVHLIVNLDNIALNTINPQIQLLKFNNTEATWSVKNTNTSDVVDTNGTSIEPGENYDLSSAKRINGRTTEAGTKTYQLTGTLTTETNTLSPAIDIKRISNISVENKINNDSTGETGASGNALARYISRQITLDDGQDAEDMKVYLTAYRPATSTILVYYKIQNGEDPGAFKDKAWVAMTQVTSTTTVSDSELKTDWKEFEFAIPTANLTGSSSEVQYTDNSITYTGYLSFSVKIVLLSSDTSQVPRVKDLRSVAIQV